MWMSMKAKLTQQAPTAKAKQAKQQDVTKMQQYVKTTKNTATRNTTRAALAKFSDPVEQRRFMSQELQDGGVNAPAILRALEKAGKGRSNGDSAN